MTQASSAKKDTQRLQRAIVDGLEDVKAQDIQVFDTEHLSPLFERVIVASGTSNRQTKALAASVRDAVRDAGFPKPRVEGEENGEWIIVDCGPAVAHIMQPSIRNYYHLEEIWGEKPVRMKFGATRPLAAATAPAAKKAAGSGSLKRSSAAKSAAAQAGKLDGQAAPAKKATAKSANGKPAVARKTTAGAKPAAAKKTAARSAPAKAPAKSSGSARTAAGKTPARKSAARTPARKA